MAETKHGVPHFYVEMDIEIDALLKLRAELNAKSPKEGPGAFKLSVNDLIIKAAAITLRRVPTVNASYTEQGTALYEDVDISVAVSIPDGLITPIVRRADQKGLAAISNEMKDLAARAKSGKLKPEEFQGGGFSISNMGMYGVSAFSAIINPPQGAILAVAAGAAAAGGARRRARGRDGDDLHALGRSPRHRRRARRGMAGGVQGGDRGAAEPDAVTGLVLREAIPADLPTVLRFVRALAEYERLAHEVRATEADFRRALFGEPRRAHALLAEIDGAAVGFAVWFYDFSTFEGCPGLFVEDVFVDPEQRGQGIGRAIFAWLARRALREGCTRMNWSVLDWNAPSIAFYRGLGAVAQDEWTVQRLSGDALAALAGME